MNPEEIKKGDKVNLTLLVTGIEDFGGEKIITTELPTGKAYFVREDDFEALSPAEPAPKYDPNRKFRAGDIVEPCQVKGRWFGTAWEHRKGIHFTVVEDEDKTGTISVKDPDSVIERYVDAVYFQLVTPVEEREPYRVDTFEDTYYISYECGIAARYDSAYHPNAKAAAEAECARLNAEYRKEVENDRR